MTSFDTDCMYASPSSLLEDVTLSQGCPSASRASGRFRGSFVSSLRGGPLSATCAGMMCQCLALAVSECMCVVRLSGTCSCLFLIKSLRCKTARAPWRSDAQCIKALMQVFCGEANKICQSLRGWGHRQRRGTAAHHLTKSPTAGCSWLAASPRAP